VTNISQGGEHNLIYKVWNKVLKNEENPIAQPDKNVTVRPCGRTRRDEKMMHEHGMQPGMMQQKDAVMMEMWEYLTDDQKKHW